MVRGFKMKKINVEIARADVDKNNAQISEEMLKKLETSDCNYPVTMKFNMYKVVGNVTKLTYTDGKLMAEVKVDEKLNLDDKIFRIYGFLNKTEIVNNVIIVKDMKMHGAGIIEKSEDIYKEDKGV